MDVQIRSSGDRVGSSERLSSSALLGMADRDLGMNRLRLTSIDGLDEFNRRCRLFSNASTQDETLDICVDGVEGTSLHLWKTTSSSGFNAVPKALAGQDLILVQMLRRGRVLCRGTSRDHLVEAGYGLILPMSDIEELQASADHEEFGLALSRATLQRHQRELSGDGSVDLPDFEITADLHTPAFRSFGRNIATLFSRLDAEPGGTLDVAFIEDMLIHQLIGAWPQRPSRQPLFSPASSRHVQRSLQFIEANLTRPMTVSEIAAAAGIGVRALQSSFRKDLGRTPIQYIIDRRLEQAHGELRRDASSPIAAIAARWGFVHMSDFSRRYRQRFGCTPSQTQIRSTRIV